MKSPVTSKRQVAWSLFFSAIGLIALAGLVWLTRQETLAVTERYRTVSERNEQAANISSITESYRETEESRQKVAAYFISQEDLPKLIEGFENLGRQVGVRFEFTEVSPVEEGTGGLQLRFKVAGDFAKQMRFLRQVETYPLKIQFANLRYASGAGASLGGAASSTVSWSSEVDLLILSYLHDKV